MNYKKSIVLFIKILIVLTSFYFLYNQLQTKSYVYNNGMSYNLKSFISWSFISQNSVLLLSVFFLMLLNWSLESLKWRFLIQKIEILSFSQSLQAIFSGITVSAFTPNRIGEYGGRVVFLEYADKIKGVIVTFIGNISQLLITILFGSIGVLYMIYHDYMIIDLYFVQRFPDLLLLLVLVVLNFLFFLIFFRVSLLTSLLGKIVFLKKYKNYIEVFSSYDSLDLFRILFYSTCRYSVFTFQYYLLLHIFQVEIPYHEVIFLIMTILFMVSIIPTFFLTEIIIRTSLAVAILGSASSNIPGILSATFLIWIINFFIPAIFGMICIMRFNFHKKGFIR